MKHFWEQYRKLTFIVVAALAAHYLKNLLSDGQVSDSILTAAIAIIAGKAKA